MRLIFRIYDNESCRVKWEKNKRRSSRYRMLQIPVWSVFIRHLLRASWPFTLAVLISVELPSSFEFVFFAVDGYRHGRLRRGNDAETHGICLLVPMMKV